MEDLRIGFPMFLAVTRLSPFCMKGTRFLYAAAFALLRKLTRPELKHSTPTAERGTPQTRWPNGHTRFDIWDVRHCIAIHGERLLNCVLRINWACGSMALT